MKTHGVRSALIVALRTIIYPSFRAAQVAPVLDALGALDPTLGGFGTAGIVNDTALACERHGRPT